LPSDYGVLATVNVANSSPYQANDYLTNLRIKSFQQGEDDRVPSGQVMDKGPKNLTRSNASSKVQAMTHILQKSQGGDSGLPGVNVADFVHLIS